MMGGGALRPGKSRRKPDLSQFSKWMIADIRPLLWIVTVGGLALAAYCVRVGFNGSLPWISAMVEGLTLDGAQGRLRFLFEPVQVRPQRRRHHIRGGQGL
ncbi:MAG: hypothetical protein ACLU9S_20530 [Oscillospiraceae bacterium]